MVSLGALALSVLYMHCTEREARNEDEVQCRVYNCFNKSRVVSLGALALSVLYMQSTGKDTRFDA